MLFVISLSIVSNLFQIVTFLFQPFMVAICVTKATVKVKLIPDFYTWDIVHITNKKKMANSPLLSQRGGGGGQIAY